jgi:hypothetical protein
MRRHGGFAGVVLAVLAVGAVPATQAQQPSRRPRDAAVAAQTPRNVPATRPEQRKTAHDQSDVFGYSNAAPSSGALADQRITGACTASTSTATRSVRRGRE